LTTSSIPSIDALMSMSIPTYKFEVQVLILREYDSWIAQGLNYDITGHGQSLDEVIDNFGLTFVGQILVDLKHGERPLANTRPAPRFYWQKFEEATRLSEKKRFRLPEEIPPAFMVSAEAADLRIYA
jgi:hypothetical protein